MAFDYEEYLRDPDRGHIMCPGCGNGIVMKAIIRAVHGLGLKKDDIVMVSGIGCSSRIPGYMDFNTLHGTHGRALCFATGIKMAKPRLTVLVITGDGDGTAIGGNHFIHACRRNIDMTVVLFNNYTYGMTGGQFSPTTPVGAWQSTSPYGNIEPPFDICLLAEAAGASFVARSTAYQAVQLEKYIARGIQHKGFSLIEVIVGCHVGYGRKNKLPTGLDLLLQEKELAIDAKRAKQLPPEELQDKIITGVFCDKDRPEYTELYTEVISRAQGKQPAIKEVGEVSVQN